MIKWIKSLLPDANAAVDNLKSGRLGKYLNNHELWHVTRHSVSVGVATGLFAAIIPFPAQMLIAAILAIIFKGNVLIAIIMTWVSNPITFVPIVYLIYFTGDKILGQTTDVRNIPMLSFDNTHSFWTSFYHWFTHLGKSFLVGLPIVAFSAALLGYLLVQLYWSLKEFLQRRHRPKH